MAAFVFAHLNIRMQPIDRGEAFEDPLQEALEENELGTVTGGGCGLGEDGEIAFCGIDIEVEDLETGLPFVAGVLTTLGAPVGSRLEYEAGGASKTMSFGEQEGLGLYLNGTDLPAEVYQNSDVNELIAKLQDALGERGSIRSHWQGPRETALYFYGPSRAAMRGALSLEIAKHPLGQKSRLIDIA
ncbi:MAG: hypothetical protein U1E65_27495 [Myxococcota bacterium]